MAEEDKSNIPEVENGHVIEVRSISHDLLVYQAHPMPTNARLYSLEPMAGARHRIIVSKEVLIVGGMISRRLRVIGINSPDINLTSQAENGKL